MVTSEVATTEATKRGAPSRKSRWKRLPSAHPSSSCPAFETTVGNDESRTSFAVSAIDTTSAPST